MCEGSPEAQLNSAMSPAHPRRYEERGGWQAETVRRLLREQTPDKPYTNYSCTLPFLLLLSFFPHPEYSIAVSTGALLPPAPCFYFHASYCSTSWPSIPISSFVRLTLTSKNINVKLHFVKLTFRQVQFLRRSNTAICPSYR